MCTSSITQNIPPRINTPHAPLTYIPLFLRTTVVPTFASTVGTVRLAGAVLERTKLVLYSGGL